MTALEFERDLTGGASIRTRVLLAVAAAHPAVPASLLPPPIRSSCCSSATAARSCRSCAAARSWSRSTRCSSGMGVAMHAGSRAPALVTLGYAGPRGHALRPQEPGLGGRRPAPALVAGAVRGRPLAGAGRIRCRACCGRCWRKRVEWRAAVARPRDRRRRRPARRRCTTFVSGDAVRVVLEASEKVPFRVAPGDRARHRRRSRATLRRRRAPAGAPHRRHRRLGAVRGRPRQRRSRSPWAGASSSSRRPRRQGRRPRLVLEFQARRSGRGAARQPVPARARPGAAGRRAAPPEPRRRAAHGGHRPRPRRRGGRGQGPGRRRSRRTSRWPSRASCAARSRTAWACRRS